MDTRTPPQQRRDEALEIPTSWAGLAGALSVAAALAVSHLLDGLFEAIPSLVVAVGDLVIDTAPSAVEQWAIATLGTADKPALIVGILVISAGIGAALGIGARRRFDVAVLGFAVFAALGGWAAGPAGQAWGAWFTAAVSATAGLLALWSLLRTATDERGEPAAADTDAVGGLGTSREREAATRQQNRRDFLRTAGGIGAAVVVTTAAGRFLLAREGVLSQPSMPPPRLPEPAVAAPDVDPAVSVDVEGVEPWLTPNDRFYRIDTALRIPRVDVATWSLAITGMVDVPFELSYEDLLAMPLEEHYVTLACVSNEVGGDLVDNARWLGVRLDRLLERAQVRPAADQIVGRSVDGFTAGFPTEVAFDGRDALVAVGMNGEPLPAAHGYPARLVVPGLFGYVSATKWLSEIELTTLEEFDGYWIPRGWAKYGPVHLQSQIQVPRNGGRVAAGPTPVAGIAYAPTRGIAAVQVRVDEGPWEAAELGLAYNDDTWRQWLYRWNATPGIHSLTVRAFDADDEPQIAEVSPVVPDGATGLHTVEVEVA